MGIDFEDFWEREASDPAFLSVEFSLNAKPPVNGGGNDGACLGAEITSALRQLSHTESPSAVRPYQRLNGVAAATP
jgi:hypothetical protein